MISISTNVSNFKARLYAYLKIKWIIILKHLNIVIEPQNCLYDAINRNTYKWVDWSHKHALFITISERDKRVLVALYQSQQRHPEGPTILVRHSICTQRDYNAII